MHCISLQVNYIRLTYIGFVVFNGKLDQPTPYIHYLLISYGIEYLRIYIPKGLTYAESFSLISLIAHYTCFYIESAILRYNKVDGFIAGSNSGSIVIFVPVSLFNMNNVNSGHA
jgi:hypothetical protein